MDTSRLLTTPNPNKEPTKCFLTASELLAVALAFAKGASSFGGALFAILSTAGDKAELTQCALNTDQTAIKRLKTPITIVACLLSTTTFLSTTLSRAPSKNGAFSILKEIYNMQNCYWARPVTTVNLIGILCGNIVSLSSLPFIPSGPITLSFITLTSMALLQPTINYKIGRLLLAISWLKLHKNNHTPITIIENTPEDNATIRFKIAGSEEIFESKESNATPKDITQEILTKHNDAQTKSTCFNKSCAENCITVFMIFAISLFKQLYLPLKSCEHISEGCNEYAPNRPLIYITSIIITIISTTASYLIMVTSTQAKSTLNNYRVEPEQQANIDEESETCCTPETTKSFFKFITKIISLEPICFWAIATTSIMAAFGTITNIAEHLHSAPFQCDSKGREQAIPMFCIANILAVIYAIVKARAGTADATRKAAELGANMR